MLTDITIITTNGEEIEVDGQVDFISFVNHDTFGKPAIIAPGDDHVRGAKRVLYVNTGGIAALDVVNEA